MPMIDVYVTDGTFADPRALAQRLGATLMHIEEVPPLPMFRRNTAAFVHALPPGSLANVEGDGDYVRVQVLTNLGALDRTEQLAVVEQFTAIIADAARRPDLKERTWVLLTEAPDGGWGLWGHAHTNAELIAAARAEAAGHTAAPMDEFLREPGRVDRALRGSASALAGSRYCGAWREACPPISGRSKRCRPCPAVEGGGDCGVPPWATIQAARAGKSRPSASRAARSTTKPPEASGRASLVMTVLILSSSTVMPGTVAWACGPGPNWPAQGDETGARLRRSWLHALLAAARALW